MEREKLPSTPLALQTYTPLSSVCASVIVSTPGRERGGGGGEVWIALVWTQMYHRNSTPSIQACMYEPCLCADTMH